ncbi:MAG: hypothetical protein ACE5GE_13425 [Phycisphaerae bacterium]
MALSVWQAFREGNGRVSRRKRLWLGLYALNLLFAAVIIYPFRTLVSRLAKTDLANDFISGFQFDAFIDFWNRNTYEFHALGYLALGLGGLYLLMHVFLSGGIVATLADDRRLTSRRFFNRCGRFFWRFVRLFLLFLIVLAAIGAAYKFGLQEWIDDHKNNATTGREAILWRALGLGILGLALTLVLIVFDYARIRTVIDGRRSMIRAVWASGLFCLRRMFSTGPLFGLNLLIVGALFAIYLLFENLFSNASNTSMIGLFVVQQVLVLGRIWMKLSFFATQTAYYQSANPLAPIEPDPTDRIIETAGVT